MKYDYQTIEKKWQDIWDEKQTFKAENGSDKPKFYAYADEMPNILECSYVTGEFSMLLKVAFQSTRELDLFIGQLQKYGKTSTQIVFSTHVGPRGVEVEPQAD